MTEETGTCTFPGCERPAADSADLGGCEKHLALFDARAEEEAWGLACNILAPWVESARYIGSDELTQVMEKALEEVDNRHNAAMEELEKAEAAAPKRRPGHAARATVGVR